MSLKSALYRLLNGSRTGRAFFQARRDLRGNEAVRAVEASSYDFVDRSRGSEKLCIVLAGYKPTLWDDVFGRLAAYVPEDVDVCIMTSGLVNDELKDLAARRGWSYLSTSVNHISFVQNLAIELHRKARWIYKIDEDMFLTEGFFEALFDTYQRVKEESLYEPAFVSPLINVNCYGHLRILEKLGLLDDFRATGLTGVKFTDGIHHDRQVIEDPRVARYLWGDSCPELRDIDALSRRFRKEGFSYSVCPIRFSTGSILFTRDAWEEFGRFPITATSDSCGLGDDEECLCRYACFTGRAIVVSENSVVGHLGYGGAQTKAMLAYHDEHPERFALKAPEDV